MKQPFFKTPTPGGSGTSIFPVAYNCLHSQTWKLGHSRVSKLAQVKQLSDCRAPEPVPTTKRRPTESQTPQQVHDGQTPLSHPINAKSQDLHFPVKKFVMHLGAALSMSVSHFRMTFESWLLLHFCPWEGHSIWTPVTHMASPNGVSCSWFWPGPAT